MSFDKDAFEERAAIQEFDGGMSRFQAETAAARAQGMERWQIIGKVAGRIVEGQRHQREAVAQHAGKNNLPGVQ
jgi:hypothetical protein